MPTSYSNIFDNSYNLKNSGIMKSQAIKAISNMNSIINSALVQWETIKNIILKSLYKTKINPSMYNPNIVIEYNNVANTSYINKLDNIQLIETFYQHISNMNNIISYEQFILYVYEYNRCLQ